jgi:hypothetical protein
MKIPQWKSIMLAVGLCWAVWVTSATVLPFGEIVPDNKNHKETKTSYEEPPAAPISIVFRIADFIDAHNGVVTAVATIFIAYFTFSLKSVARDQHEIMASQMLIQRELARPQIFMVGVEVVPETEWAVISIIWRNSGQTPPQKFVTGREIITPDSPELPSDFDYSVRFGEPVPIGADMEVRTNALVVGNDRLRGPVRGGDNLFIWGKGYYTDSLSPGVTHHIDFCFRLAVRERTIAFVPYGPHNRIFDTHDADNTA